MPRLITGSELRNAIQQETFVKGGIANNAEDVKYDFRLSNYILKAKFGRTIDAAELSQSEQANLIVEPGEVVFVLSMERLALPADMVAQLSPKRKMSQAGVLTLGGLMIDPGYEGPLLVGLFNFSSTPFTLHPGRKLIGATFYRLSTEEARDLKGDAEPLEGFPNELVDVMRKYEPVGSKSLSDAISRIEHEIDAIKQDLRDRDKWKEILEHHDEQIVKLIKGLEAETEARRRGEDRFSTAITELRGTFQLVKGGSIAIWAILAIILIPLLIQWLPKLLEWINP